MRNKSKALVIFFRDKNEVIIFRIDEYLNHDNIETIQLRNIEIIQFTLMDELHIIIKHAIFGIETLFISTIKEKFDGTRCSISMIE